MPGLFEWIARINEKTNLILDGDNPYKDYPVYQINNAMSQHLDTVLLGNEMNKRPFLSARMQEAFLFNSVTKKKRFGKWAKAEVMSNEVDIQVISEYYQVNRQKAEEYSKLISAQHVEQMRKLMNKGGADVKSKSKK